MKKTALALAFKTLCIIFLSTATSVAQEAKMTVSQDAKFENLLKEKRRINSSITVNDRYKIQIYNGDSDASKKTLTDFRKQYKNMDGTIIFNTPFYKVWVGNFRTRIEAERNLAELRKSYPSALLIRPNK